MKRYLFLVLLVGVALVVGSNVARAQDPVDATCTITVTVDGIMEWAGGTFPAIGLTPNIAAQADQPEGFSSLDLYLNGDVSITAQTSAAAELEEDGAGTDTLYTEYKLVYDFDGTGADSGGAPVDWTVYSSFLVGGSAVTHQPLDGAVNLTLWARASNPTGTLADAGPYTATQTLTATWVP